MARIGKLGKTAFIGGKPEPEYMGSIMLFPQASAPLGWTKISSINDTTVRIVNTTPVPLSVTGTTNTSNVYTSLNLYGNVTGTWPIGTDSHTTSIAEMEQHGHNYFYTTTFSQVGGVTGGTFVITNFSQPWTTGSAGSGGGHSHTGNITQFNITSTPVNLAVKYVDVILARY